jgi:hypothetical protein
MAAPPRIRHPLIALAASLARGAWYCRSLAPASDSQPYSIVTSSAEVPVAFNLRV